MVVKYFETAEIFFVSVWYPCDRCPPCGRSVRRPRRRSPPPRVRFYVKATRSVEFYLLLKANVEAIP
jgi:hypothetical protein